MKNKIIISASGPDRKGIVSEISSVINQLNGNIETSRMIRLEEQFSILILTELDSKKIKKLQKELEQINNLQLQIITTKNKNKNYKNKFHLYINGADNEGIVYSFSNYLSKVNLNIEEVNTSIKNAPMSATPLFMMDIIVATNQKNKINEIIKNLNEIAEKLGVEVNLKKIN